MSSTAQTKRVSPRRPISVPIASSISLMVRGFGSVYGFVSWLISARLLAMSQDLRLKIVISKPLRDFSGLLLLRFRRSSPTGVKRIQEPSYCSTGEQYQANVVGPYCYCFYSVHFTLRWGSCSIPERFKAKLTCSDGTELRERCLTFLQK